MRSLGVNPVEYNIDKDRGRREELKRITGRTSIPVIDIEGTIIPGYSPDAINAALHENSD